MKVKVLPADLQSMSNSHLHLPNPHTTAARSRWLSECGIDVDTRMDNAKIYAHWKEVNNGAE